MAKRICSVEGCERNVFGHGWCSRHYTAWRRHDDPLYVSRGPAGETCVVEGCETRPVAKSLCPPHYAKNRKHGDPLYVVAYDERKPCLVESCGRQSRRYGYCEMHSQRFKKYGSPELPERERPLCQGPDCVRTIDPIQGTSGLCRGHGAQARRGRQLAPLEVAPALKNRPTVCTQEGCDRPHKARGLCKTHNKRALLGLDVSKPIVVRLPPGPCSVEGCDQARFANSFCQSHNSNRVARFRRHHITVEFGLLVYEAQGRACAICRAEAPQEALKIDHDHNCCPGTWSCGDCIRGLLCGACNLGIGQLRDDPARLRSAIRYLEPSANRDVVQVGGISGEVQDAPDRATQLCSE